MNRIFCIILAIILSGSAFGFAEKKGKNPSFKGRVILVNENYIEVKLGAKQNIFYFSDDSVYKNRAGEELKKTDIIICQVVELSYHVSGGKRLISTISVLKESDCVR